MVVGTADELEAEGLTSQPHLHLDTFVAKQVLETPTYHCVVLQILATKEGHKKQFPNGTPLYPTMERTSHQIKNHRTQKNIKSQKTMKRGGIK